MQKYIFLTKQAKKSIKLCSRNQTIFHKGGISHQPPHPFHSLFSPLFSIPKHECLGAKKLHIEHIYSHNRTISDFSLRSKIENFRTMQPLVGIFAKTKAAKIRPKSRILPQKHLKTAKTLPFHTQNTPFSHFFTRQNRENSGDFSFYIPLFFFYVPRNFFYAPRRFS